jgi:hypothetical protein
LIGRGINALAGAGRRRADPMKVVVMVMVMMVSPGEIFQVCFITRVDGVAHLMSRRQGPAAVTQLGAPGQRDRRDDRLRGRMIGCVGSIGWLPLRPNGY